MLAQRGGGGHGGGGGGMHGGGSIGGHSGGSIGGHSGGTVSSGRFGGGFRGGGFNRGPAFRSNFGFRRFNNFIYPGYYGYGYGYYDPYWYDPFWDSDYGYPSSYPSAGYSGDYGYSSGAPPVIINQQYMPPPPGEPAIREYVGPAPATAPPPAAQQKYAEPLYLIAFRDGNIKAVAAYWVQGTVLHYVTLEHEQKQAPITSVDRDLSNRLNHERNVTFQLP